MNSRVIKFVAGGGKTTYSEDYLKNNKNGLYIAFTNSVVECLNGKGYLSKTIDSLFSSFIIPKFTSIIPLIATGSKIRFIETSKLPPNLIGVSNIHIDLNGDIYNRSKKTNINIMFDNNKLHNMPYFKNGQIIKYIFGKEELRLTNELRAELSTYLLNKYTKEIIEFLSSRFSYVIIDEAQDLSGYREIFADIIYNSNIYLIILGDDNQNIIGNGVWFEKLDTDEKRNISYRCPENNCKWIREKLEIKIYGNSDYSEFKIINYDEIFDYDDGDRFLLYSLKSGKNKEIVEKWKGPKSTIKTAKGSTIDSDIVIIGNDLSTKNLYTAITRTTKNVYSTVKKVKKRERRSFI